MDQVGKPDYDFVVFENWHLATNHLKDVGLIASLLRDCGYTVAVVDVYHNINKEFVGDIPCIEVSHKGKLCKYPEKGPLSKEPYSKVIGIINRWIENRHLKSVLKELKGKYRHLYCGSYYVKMPIGWLRRIPSSSSAFFWGLRSSRLVMYQKKMFDSWGITSFLLRRYFDRHPNLKFFVSDQLIYDEFVALGITKDRLVIRPERYIDDYPAKNHVSDKTFTLLSIGSLRPEKRIERILAALRKLDDKDVHYVIAGASRSGYESVIEKELVKDSSNNVKRLNYRLSEEEYNELINQADFLVLCDRPQASNVTNGTMNEALLAGVPIIAPNYYPYKYVIEHFKVGVAFDPDDPDSLARAIHDAKANKRVAFADAIHKYQSQFLKKTVVRDFGKSLQSVIK